MKYVACLILCKKPHHLTEGFISNIFQIISNIVWSKNMLLNVVFSRAFRGSSIYYTDDIVCDYERGFAQLVSELWLCVVNAAPSESMHVMEIYYWLQNWLYWQDAHNYRMRFIVQPYCYRFQHIAMWLLRCLGWLLCCCWVVARVFLGFNGLLPWCC